MTPVDPRPPRVGIQIAPQHASWAQLRAACAQVEELGADIVFTWDHFFPLSGDLDGPHFEAWTLLSAWAAATTRVELGVLVSATSYRNPALLADMARTVDHVSDGRLILGLGAGWAERDYQEYGYPFGGPRERLDALEADLTTIKDRWTRLNPPPTRPIPVLIGGGGERRTLRIVAEHADIWHGFGTPEEIAGKHAVLDRWCGEVGRDPLSIERSAGVSVRGRDIEPVGLDYPAHAQALYDVGTRLVTFGLTSPPYDLGPVRDLLGWRDDVRRGLSRRPGPDQGAP